MTYTLSDIEFQMVYNDDLDMYLNYIVTHDEIEKGKLIYRNLNFTTIFMVCHNLQAWKIMKVLFLRGSINMPIYDLFDYQKNYNDELRKLTCTEICRISEGYIFSDSENDIKILNSLSNIVFLSDLLIEELQIRNINNVEFLGNIPSIKKLKLYKNICTVSTGCLRHLIELSVDDQNLLKNQIFVGTGKIQKFTLTNGVYTNDVLVKNMPKIEMFNVKMRNLYLSSDLKQLTLIHVTCTNVFYVDDLPWIQDLKLIDCTFHGHETIFYCTNYQLIKCRGNIKIYDNTGLVVGHSTSIPAPIIEKKDIKKEKKHFLIAIQGILLLFIIITACLFYMGFGEFNIAMTFALGMVFLVVCCV